MSGPAAAVATSGIASGEDVGELDELITELDKEWGKACIGVVARLARIVMDHSDTGDEGAAISC